ncbi:MAG: efflux RND transporter periplasmic adaptor subunit, partial [bacterium]
PARFRVDAFEETFTGVVQQIRLSAATIQNVVTYPVILQADNSQLKLFPGMTANVDFEVERRTNCLAVPNSALRFTPEPAAGKTPAPSTASGSSGRTRGRGPRVWIQPDPAIAPTSVVVRVGITDGSLTEIREPSPLGERDAVLTGVSKPGDLPAETVNPFMPKMPGGRTGQRGH